MIDKFFYWLFGIVDAYSKWIENNLTNLKRKREKRND
jgi:hypothetical protein